MLASASPGDDASFQATYLLQERDQISLIKRGFFIFFFLCVIQHCVFCRPLYSTVSEGAEIEHSLLTCCDSQTL